MTSPRRIRVETRKEYEERLGLTRESAWIAQRIGSSTLPKARASRVRKESLLLFCDVAVDSRAPCPFEATDVGDDPLVRDDVVSQRFGVLHLSRLSKSALEEPASAPKSETAIRRVLVTT